MGHIRIFVLTLLVATSAAWGLAAVYQQPEDFITQAFDGEPPPPRALFLRGEAKQGVEHILGHKYRKIRIRYWLKNGRSVWVLEEIGKERPITTGIVINQSKIEQVKVLIFRESRGWEVRHDFFTEQFTNAALDPKQRLDRPIDNVSGATLSVRAVTRLARLALYLHRHVSNAHA